MKQAILIPLLMSCSMLDDDSAGANYSYERAPASCLDMAGQTEAEIARELPGNASKINFTYCQIEYDPWPTAKAIAMVELRQNVCSFGRCVTAWSYTTRAYSEAMFDTDCNMSAVRVWTQPEIGMLNPIISRATQEIPPKWPAFRDKHGLFWVCD